MGVLLTSLIGCGCAGSGRPLSAVPHDGGGRRKHKRYTVTCLFETKYFCPRRYTGEIPHMFVFWVEGEPMASYDARGVAMNPAFDCSISNVTTMQHHATSVYGHQRHILQCVCKCWRVSLSSTGTELLVLRVCEWHFYCTAMFRFGLSFSAHPFVLEIPDHRGHVR